MSIQKKSLISTLQTAKKANVASAPVTGTTILDTSKSVKAVKMSRLIRKAAKVSKSVKAAKTRR